MNIISFVSRTCNTRTYTAPTLLEMNIISFVSRTCYTRTYTTPTWLQIQIISFVSRTSYTRTYTDNYHLTTDIMTCNPFMYNSSPNEENQYCTVTKCNHLLTILSSLHIVKESDETKFILLMQLSPTYN
jgi:hypothetical protein